MFFATNEDKRREKSIIFARSSVISTNDYFIVLRYYENLQMVVHRLHKINASIVPLDSLIFHCIFATSFRTRINREEKSIKVSNTAGKLAPIFFFQPIDLNFKTSRKFVGSNVIVSVDFRARSMYHFKYSSHGGFLLL